MARILVIEDNPTNLQLMVYLLKAFGHQTLEAVDGQDGLDAVNREAPDLIICDVHIPRLDGYEVCRRLKADPVHRKIPLIAVTALAMVGDRNSIIAAGFDGYISKPIDPETFVAEVEGYLDLPHTGIKAPAESAVGLAQAAPPAARAPVRAAVVPACARTGDGSKCGAIFLVLDDRLSNRELMHSILEPQGYRVLHAGSVAEALALLRRERPNVILSDVHLPDASGFELIRAVKAEPRWSNIPFVFVTSTAWPDAEQQRGIALGADKYLIRPIDPETLLSEIEGCLKERERGNNPGCG